MTSAKVAQTHRATALSQIEGKDAMNHVGAIVCIQPKDTSRAAMGTARLRTVSAATLGAVALMGGAMGPVRAGTGSCSVVNGGLIVSDTRSGSCFLETNEQLVIQDSGSLTNSSATVRVGEGVTGVSIDNYGAISGGNTTIFNLGTISEIVNAGSIRSSYTSIYNDEGVIGLINNEAGGEIGGASDTLGIANFGQIGVINNDAGATIKGLFAGIYSPAGGLGTLNNAGAIIGNIDTESTTINILGIQSSITGEVFNPGGSVNVRSGARFTPENTFTSNTFFVESNGTLRVSGASHALTVESPASDAFHNAGTLEVAERLVGNVVGNYTQSGTLRIHASSTSNHGRLAVDGNVTLTETARFHVDVNLATHTLAVGQTLAGVITASGDVNNSAPSNNVSDNSYLFDFESVTNDKAVDLQIVAAASDPVPTPTRASTPAPAPLPQMGIVPGVIENNLLNGVPSARVLDGFIRGGATGTDFDQVVTHLGKLPTSRTVTLAVGQIMPSLHGNAASALLWISGSTSVVIQQQGDAGLDEGLQEPNGGRSGGADGHGHRGKGLWVKPLGHQIHQDGAHGASGYKLATYGLMGGVQTELSASSTLGFGLGYLGSEVKGQDFAASHRSDIESVQVVGHGQHALAASAWRLNWQGDFTRSRVESARDMAFIGRTAQAQYDGDAWHLGVALNKAYAANPLLTVTPMVALDWRSFKAKGYTETGAGALNLQVNAQTAQEVMLKVGAQLRQQISPQTQWLASAALGHDLRNQRHAVTARFTGGGVAFTTEGLPPSRTVAELGVGIRHQTSDSMELLARYDLRLRKGLRDQTASLRLNWAF